MGDKDKSDEESDTVLFCTDTNGFDRECNSGGNENAQTSRKQTIDSSSNSNGKGTSNRLTRRRRDAEVAKEGMIVAVAVISIVVGQARILWNATMKAKCQR
jgi:hypothetical protein